MDCKHQPIGGRGSPKTGYVTFEREFNIREVEADEAPIVAEVLNPDDTVVGRYRVHERRFYSQTSKKTDQNDLRDTTSVANLVGWKNAAGTNRRYQFADIFSHVTTHFEDGEGHRYSVQAYDLLGINYYPSERTIKEFYDVEDEIGLQHALATQSYERRGLIIDGAMWFQIDEPRLVSNLDRLTSKVTDNNQARLQAKDALGRWDLRVMNPDSTYANKV